jgi:hypothetical protein
VLAFVGVGFDSIDFVDEAFIMQFLRSGFHTTFVTSEFVLLSVFYESSLLALELLNLSSNCLSGQRVSCSINTRLYLQNSALRFVYGYSGV